ncbi:hypothetical protein OG339_48975 (plasmid) [Streptosporangium sp. NBC_01495]|uniref:hypothetical protein n=1 Tax=Streptosporangium sp. NBC_01495 TaxID=2903899 RepID=UPI002E2FF8FA|nr:hypothetical protein [Streptosporangium sp. NBC_01495]
MIFAVDAAADHHDGAHLEKAAISLGPDRPDWDIVLTFTTEVPLRVRVLSVLRKDGCLVRALPTAQGATYRMSTRVTKVAEVADVQAVISLLAGRLTVKRLGCPYTVIRATARPVTA